MTAKKFIKDLSEIYFSEKNKSWKSSRLCWNFIFTAFFSLYLLQIYAAFANYEVVAVAADSSSDWRNPEQFWAIQSQALYLEGIVLLGIFIRFLSTKFQGKWAVRFGILGEFIALAAFFRHFLWTHELYPLSSGCVHAPALIGTPDFSGSLNVLFFLILALSKVFLIIALVWKTVRK